MNGQRFDAIARSLVDAPCSRRRVTRALTGAFVAAVGGTLGLSGDYIAAAPKRTAVPLSRRLPVRQVAVPTISPELRYGGISGTAYTSPTWGYRFTWPGTPWLANPFTEVVNLQLPERSISAMDEVTLRNGIAAIVVGAYRGADGDAERCLDDYVATIRANQGAGGFTSVLGADGRPIASVTAGGVVYGVYRGAPSRLVYVQCATLIPGEAVLYASASFPEDQFNKEIESAIAIIDAINMTGLRAPTVGTADQPIAGGDFVDPRQVDAPAAPESITKIQESALPVQAPCAQTADCSQASEATVCEQVGNRGLQCCRQAADRCDGDWDCCGWLTCATGQCEQPSQPTPQLAPAPAPTPTPETCGVSGDDCSYSGDCCDWYFCTSWGTCSEQLSLGSDCTGGYQCETGCCAPPARNIDYYICRPAPECDY